MDRKYNTVIVIPDEGYTVSIYKKAVTVYKQLLQKGYSPVVIVSGATRNPIEMKAYGLKLFLEKLFKIIPINHQIDLLKEGGISPEHIFHEDKSGNTRENASNTVKIIRELDIAAEDAYLVSSIEGILRKYLTFKKAIADAGLRVNLNPRPAFQLFPLGLTLARISLIPGEFLRIWKYHKLGHL